MEIVIKILQFIASFSLLVIIHELGHFMFARMFGIRVEKFYLFFDPWFSLLKFKYKGTEYGIGWIPFGGYVKIAGMIDESMDLEQMKQPAKPDEFRSKPAWQRLLVMVGGVTMNVVLALCIYTGMNYAWGKSYYTPEEMKFGYTFNELGHEIGFEDGDILLEVDGKRYDDFTKLLAALVIDNAFKVSVERNGKMCDVYITDEYRPLLIDSKDFISPRMPCIIKEVTPGMAAAGAGFMAGDTIVALNGEAKYDVERYLEAFQTMKGSLIALTVGRDSAGIAIRKTLDVTLDGEGRIGVGITLFNELIPLHTEKYTFWESIPAAFARTGEEIGNYWKQVKMIIRPETGAYKSLGGVISIGSIFPGHWDWYGFWRITAFLSIVLAVMNILPIPMLDGGHVLFLLYEVVTRRKPSDRFMEYAQWVGLIIVMSLIIYATGNDIYRFFIK